MPPPENPAAAPEIVELKRGVRDLVALSTLPALWTHAEPAEIAQNLCDALVGILRSDFVYVRLHASGHLPEAVDVAAATSMPPREALAWLEPALEPCLDLVLAPDEVLVRELPGRGPTRLALRRFGHSSILGVLVAGSTAEDFPDELQRLAAGVGVNQAAIALQRHELELGRRESERRFHQFMEHVPGMAWIKDEAGRFLYANETSLRAFGKTMAELAGRTDADILAPETAAACMASDREAARTRSPLQVLEDFRGADGQVRHMLVTKFAIPTGDPGSVLVGGIAIDATERIEAEEALRDSDRRKDEFLAMLAHELRNPLAPVRNAAQIIKSKADAAPELHWPADIIERQTAHMARLIDDLLDVSRITRGAITLKRERLVLQDVVRSVAEDAKPLLDAHSHSLALALPAAPIVLDADRTRIAQVLSNLLNNAAKYTREPGQVKLEAHTEDGWVVVRVSDNGIGIPEPMLERVFELFVQVDHSLERTQGGLGIGLTMVRRLVEMHGGTVRAESAGPGSGATFVMRLPAALAPAAGAHSAQGEAPRAPVAHRVLVVDDNRDAAQSLGALLELHGCEVRLAYDGVEALGAFSAYQPDVVVLDIGLPRMNGYEVARHIRAQSGERSVACIAMTGFGKEDDRARAVEAGFDFHLTKPVAFEALQEVLGRIAWRQRGNIGVATPSQPLRSR